ncbi:MAG: AAA family ATPase [Microbacterium sp.]
MPDDDAGLSAQIHADGSAVFTVDETPQQIATTRVEDARREIVRRAAEIAAVIDAPMPLVVNEPDGSWPMIVHPDGRVDSDEGASTPRRAQTDEATSGRRRRTTLPADIPPRPEVVPPVTESVEQSAIPPRPPLPTPVPVPSVPKEAIPPVPPLPTSDPQPAQEPEPEPAPAPRQPEQPVAVTIPPVPEPPDGATTSRSSFVKPTFATSEPKPEVTERAVRSSFLDATSDVRGEAATQSVRGLFNRITGAHLSPGAAERAEREDRATVAGNWTGARTIAVVNAKGGSGKSPSTALLAATFARFGGAGVLAWDNNQTRGTLGWRTEQSQHEATLHDLLPETERLLQPSAQAGDLAKYVHHQTRDRFDVLRSQPLNLAELQRLSGEDVDRIHAVASKYYRLIVMDSGNDEADPVWLRMIDHTDQIVLATNTRPEHAEAGALLLEALTERDERSAALAKNAVTIISQADAKASNAEVRKIVDGFTPLVREVAFVPYDVALVDGQLALSTLKPVTQRAWLGAAAAVARGL